MLWFLKARAERTTLGTAKPTRIDSAKELLALIPDIAHLRKQDVALKIWLPRVVAETGKVLADYYGQSQSTWLRDRLLIYGYGVAVAVVDRMRGDDDRPMFSRKSVGAEEGRWVYKVPQLGKNAVAFKLWISADMKRDLATLAAHAGLELSPFVREIIISDLLGHGSLPERPALFSLDDTALTDWESGAEVPMIEIEEEDFDNLGDAERVWKDAN